MRLWVLMFIFCLPMISNAGQVYKWRDKYGVTHYSDIEPDNQNAQRKTMNARNPKVLPSAEPKKLSYCEQLNSNISVLTDSKTVQMDVNNDGIAEELSSEQRMQQTKAMQAAVAAKCSK